MYFMYSDRPASKRLKSGWIRRNGRYRFIEDVICPADVTLKGTESHQEQISVEKGKKKHGDEEGGKTERWWR